MRVLPLLVVLLLVAAACGSDDSDGTAGSAGTDSSGATSTTAAVEDGPFENPYDGYSSDVYGDDDVWLCRPDLTGGPCNEDLTATDVAPDGTQSPVPFEPATDADYDCFYVYPTLDYAAEAGNHPFEEPNILEGVTTQVQAGRFGSLCNLYVPRYRQATIGSYDAAQGGDIFDTEPFNTAYDDVVDSFKHYMATWNDGRPLVLLGHSQGTHHLIRLVQEEFDDAPAMRGQLISALLVGPTGRLRVPDGELVGGSFDNIALCSSSEETGCAIGFDSFGVEEPPTRGGPDDDGNLPACVDPARLVDGDDQLTAAYFGRTVPGVTTFTEVIEDYYTATCTVTDDGVPYLQIGEAPAPDDARDLTHVAKQVETSESFHTLDYNFALGDLLAIVEAQAAAYGVGG